MQERSRNARITYFTFCNRCTHSSGYPCFFFFPKDSTEDKENTEQADSEEADDSDNVYKNGNFEGSGTGYGGTITVQVTLEDDTITAVSVVSAPGEDSAYLSQGENVINSVISEQSTDVDTISGATFSSTGILEAVNDALSKAENA